MIKYDETQMPWDKESRPKEIFDYDNIEESLEKGLDINIYHIVYNSLHKGVEFVRTRVLPTRCFERIMSLAAVEDKLEIIKRNVKYLDSSVSDKKDLSFYYRKNLSLCDIYVTSNDDSKIREWIETLEEYKYFKDTAWSEIRYQYKLNDWY